MMLLSTPNLEVGMESSRHHDDDHDGVAKHIPCPVDPFRTPFLNRRSPSPSLPVQIEPEPCVCFNSSIPRHFDDTVKRPNLICVTHFSSCHIPTASFMHVSQLLKSDKAGLYLGKRWIVHVIKAPLHQIPR